MMKRIDKADRVDKLGRSAFVLVVSVLSALSISPAFLWAAPQKPGVIKTRLANGMRVLLYPRHGLPAIAFRIYYRVGSVDEEMGQTGLANWGKALIFAVTLALVFYLGSLTASLKDLNSAQKIIFYIHHTKELI